MRRHTIAVTTTAGGAFTGYSDGPVNGHVCAVQYVPDGTTPLDTGADVTLTGAESGIAILTWTNIGTSAAVKCPRAATHDVTGAALLYAAGGAPVGAPIPVADEALKLVVAQGGNVLKGTFHVYVGS